MRYDESGQPIGFDTFPVLVTDRLVLREITLEDAEFWLRNFSDPDVVDLTAFEPPKDIEGAKEEIKTFCIDAFANSTGIRWGITLKGDPRLIGTAGYYRWAREGARSAHIGYDLMKEHRGKGIMREALEAIVGFGFESMRLHRIQVQIDPRNIASIRLVERLGFRKEGVLREDQLFRGRWVDDAVYSLLEQEWKRA